MVSLKEIENKIEKLEPRCNCGQSLDKSHLDWYGPHNDGWLVEDLGAEDEKTWLFLRCSNCSYDTALWKIGITRPNGEVIR